MALRTTPEITVDSEGVDAPAGRRSPLTWVGVVALGFVVVVVAILALPGGNVVGDTTTNVRITTVLPELEQGEPVVQPFVASEDRLASIYVTFGTYFGAARCDVAVTLVERSAGAEPGTGTQIAARDWSCADLPDTGRFEVLEFEPIESSAGTLYDVVIERIDSGSGQGAVVWAGEPKGDALPVLLDGEPSELSTAVRGEYDPQPHRWDHMAQTLQRLAAYGPEWGSPAAFVAMVALLGAILALAPVARRSTRSLIILVAVLAVLRGLVWSAAVPALEAMDEPAHFAYVQFLAEEREFPGHVDNHEIFSERLHGTVAALNVESTTPGDRPDYSEGGEERTLEQIEGLSPTGGGGGPGSMYAPFYYLPAVPLYEAAGDGILAQIAWARLWSVLLGAAAAVLLVLIGRQLFPGSSAAQTAFAIAGVFQPMVAHQFAIVNNDGWVIAAGFAALAVGLELTRRSRAPGLALLAGAIIGAGLLGKPFAIACAVPLAAGWLVGKIRARQRSVRVLAGEAGLVVVGFALTYGLWAANAARLNLNTSEVPARNETGQSLAGFLDANFGGRLNGARMIWADQMWGDFGWVRIPLPPPIPIVIFAIEVLLLIGLCVWAVMVLVELRRRRAGTGRTVTSTTAEEGEEGERVDAAPTAAAERGPSGTSGRATDGALAAAPIPLDVRILVVAATIAGVIVTLYAAGWVYYMSTGANDLIQGRYALLAVPAFIAGPALLLERFSHGRVRPTVVNIAAAFGMVAANLLGILVVLEAFYG